MKVLVNGGLNLSELDGWWAEAYASELGWALGDRNEHDANPDWDRQEAESLYRLLEEEVIPLFYHQRDADGCPCGWVAKVRESMSRLTPQFSSNRMLQDYISTLYVPASQLLAARQDRAVAEDICRWRKDIASHWSGLHFGELTVRSEGDVHHFGIPVYLDDLNADSIAVQLYANGWDGHDPMVVPMIRGNALSGGINSYYYACDIPADRPAEGFTPRIVPQHEAGLVPLESHSILWYR